MNANRITLVTLAVTDLSRACAFYRDLGWEAEQVLDDVAFFDMGGQKFGLYSRAKLAEDLDKPESELGTGAMTLAQNYGSKAEVDHAYDRALAAGAVALKRPETMFWGGYSGTYADPDGHVWEIAMNPFWKLDEKGRLAT